MKGLTVKETNELKRRRRSEAGPLGVVEGRAMMDDLSIASTQAFTTHPPAHAHSLFPFLSLLPRQDAQAEPTPSRRGFLLLP